MVFTFPKYVSGCGCTAGSPYISEVDARRSFAPQRFARPSMLIVPIVFVLIVLMALYW
jgi:hypothetical protein